MAANAVAQVRHARLALEDPDPLELTVLRIETVEQPASLSGQHRDDVELELIADAGRQRELRNRGALDRDLLSPAACLTPVIAVSTSVT